MLYHHCVSRHNGGKTVWLYQIDQPTEPAYVCIMIAAQVGLAKVAPRPMLYHIIAEWQKKLINLKQSRKTVAVSRDDVRLASSS